MDLSGAALFSKFPLTPELELDTRILYHYMTALKPQPHKLQGFRAPRLLLIQISESASPSAQSVFIYPRSPNATMPSRFQPKGHLARHDSVAVRELRCSSGVTPSQLIRGYLLNFTSFPVCLGRLWLKGARNQGEAGPSIGYASLRGSCQRGSVATQSLSRLSCNNLRPSKRVKLPYHERRVPVASLCCCQRMRLNVVKAPGGRQRILPISPPRLPRLKKQ